MTSLEHQLNTSTYIYQQLSQQNASIDFVYQQLNTSFNMVNKQLNVLQLGQYTEDNPAIYHVRTCMTHMMLHLAITDRVCCQSVLQHESNMWKSDRRMDEGGQHRYDQHLTKLSKWTEPDIITKKECATFPALDV